MAGGFISSKERETLTLLSKDTEYASDLQTYGWKFAQKFPPKQPFRRKANRNRSTILPKTVLFRDLLRPTRFVGGFENQRHVVEAGVAGDVPEALDPQHTLAQRSMTIDMAAEGLQRIVQVHPPQVFQSDDPIQLGECRIASRSGTQVVSGRKRMTGINADTHARLVLDLVDDIRQVFEPESQVGTLSGRVLDDGRDALRAVEGDIDRLGDAVQALLRRNSVQVAARMEIKTIEAEGLAAAHFVDEGRPGLLEPFAARDVPG